MRNLKAYPLVEVEEIVQAIYENGQHIYDVAWMLKNSGRVPTESQGVDAVIDGLCFEISRLNSRIKAMSDAISETANGCGCFEKELRGGLLEREA